MAEQELRHARFDGWLIKRAESEVEKVLWKTLGVASKSRKARMKDAEFVSILMLVILEQKFVGFPQHKIDELYAKYDFDLDEIPEDEAELNDLDESEVEFDGVTKELVNEFEQKFSTIVEFITAMEDHNNCITNHKKRLFTDFYSLWVALVFHEEIMERGVETIANLYEQFISLVDEAFVKTRAGENLNELPQSVQTYFGNSTGAATEEEPRKLRNTALMEYVNEN